MLSICIHDRNRIKQNGNNRRKINLKNNVGVDCVDDDKNFKSRRVRYTEGLRLCDTQTAYTIYLHIMAHAVQRTQYIHTFSTIFAIILAVASSLLLLMQMQCLLRYE